LTDESVDVDRLRKELGYYKRQLEDLAGANLKLDHAISGLKRSLQQKRQGFALLSELQDSIGTQQEISGIIDIALRAITATLGMDKTVVLVPTEQVDRYRPSQWIGIHQEHATAMGGLSLELPAGLAQGSDVLVVNKDTPETPAIAQVRAAFDLPFFVCVPIRVEELLIGLLLSGRMREGRPFFPPFDQGDVDTFEAIAGLISAFVRHQRVAVLKETDRLKTEFFANISHEFRTPITLTLGPLKALLDGRFGDLAPAVSDQLRVIQRNQGRLRALVDEILDLAKLEAGGIRLKAAPMPDVNRFVEEMVGRFRPAAEQRGIELRLSLRPEEATTELYLDREKLDKLLYNLLSNALKFTKRGHVEVVTEVEDGVFSLTVKDTGVGIRADQLPYVFDRFRQADGGESREYTGTGLGLTWVKEIAELHGGDVSVQSQYGEGSSFRVRFPLGKKHLDPGSIVESAELSAAAVAESGEPLAVLERVDGGDAEEFNRRTEAEFQADRPTLVYAEDNPDMRQYVGNLLVADHNVFLAVDGQDGLEKIRRYQPDLILTDHMMPRLGGKGLLQAVKQQADLKGIPVIFLTARAGLDARVESLEAGADDYVTKPFDESELLARVRNLLRARAQERELAVLNRRLEARIEEQVAELVRSGELKHFLPQPVAESVLSGHIGPDRRSERLKVTVLFADMVGSTDLVDSLEPEEWTVLTNEYLRELTAVAVSHHGTVVGFIGDSLMVVYGAPQVCDPAAHALAACQTAVEMQVCVKQLAAEWRRRGLSQELGVRIGIDTGYCTVGIFGSELLQCYTAQGVTVNTAARLQSAAEPGEILCAFPTYALVQDRVSATAKGELTLRGIARPVETYRIIQ